MIYPLVVELAADGIPVTVSCRVLKLARQPYYRWKNTPVGDAVWVRAHRVNALFDAHGEDPTFGYRFLADEARRAGWRMSRRTAWKLCSDAGILSSAQRRRRGKGKKAGPPVFDDLVKRQFRADAPNRLWLTDITEHWTSEGKLYCCAIKDGRFQGASATPSFGGSRDGVLERSVRRIFDASRWGVGAGNGAALPCEHGRGRRVGKACGHGDPYGSPRRH